MSTVDTIASALPAFITEQNSLIPQLMAAYYTWLDDKSPQDITLIRDVNKTQYLDDLVREFVVGISTTDNTDVPLLVSNVIDLYRMKGTPVGIDAFYRLVYGVEPEITFPRDRTFALSASTWLQQYQMETDITDPAVANALIGQVVASATGSAHVISAHFASSMVSQRCILTIHDVRGNFAVGQRLVVGSYAFKLLGSLGAFILPSIDPGVNSQILSATSATGASAKVSARANVVAVSDVQATVVDGGSGYSLLPNFSVSNIIADVSHLSIGNVATIASNTVVTQQAFHAEYIYEPAAPIAVGATLTLRSGATTRGTANVVALLPSTTLGQKLLLTSSASSANITGSNNFVFGANTYNNVAFTDNSATGRLVAFDDYFSLELSSQVAAISHGDQLYQYQGSTLRGQGTVVAKPASNQVVVERTFGLFSNTFTLKASANSSVANVATVVSASSAVGIANVVGTFAPGNPLTFSNGTANVIAVTNTDGVALSVSELDNRETLVGNAATFAAGAYASATLSDGDFSGQTVYAVPSGRIKDVDLYVSKLPTRAPLVSVSSPTMSNAAIVNLTVSNASGFEVGQEIQQIGGTGVLVTMTASANTALLRHGDVFAVPSKANPGFVGVITEFPNTAAVNTQAIVHQYFGDTDWAAEGWTTLQTYNSNVTVAVSAVAPSSNVGAGVKATITSIANNVLSCTVNHRYAGLWTAPSVVTDVDRFYSSNVTAVAYDTSKTPGTNASIRLSLSPSEVNTHTLNVEDSGQGFVNGQVVTLTDNNGVVVGNAIASVVALGTVPGISTNDRSKLAAGQHLYDGRIYQQHSIRIASSVNVDKYDVNQQFTDIAGFENLSTPLIKSTLKAGSSVNSTYIGTSQEVPPVEDGFMWFNDADNSGLLALLMENI